jgi:hypothetical protein
LELESLSHLEGYLNGILGYLIVELVRIVARCFFQRVSSCDVVLGEKKSRVRGGEGSSEKCRQRQLESLKPPGSPKGPAEAPASVWTAIAKGGLAESSVVG